MATFQPSALSGTPALVRARRNSPTQSYGILPLIGVAGVGVGALALTYASSIVSHLATAVAAERGNSLPTATALGVLPFVPLVYLPYAYVTGWTGTGSN